MLKQIHCSEIRIYTQTLSIMKHIKKIDELYDDPNQHISKDDLKYIMGKPVWDKIQAGKYHKKAYLDVPAEMFDDDTTNRISTIYSYENKLKKEIPELSKFKVIEKNETHGNFIIKYELLKNIDNVGNFSLELQIMNSNEKKMFIFTPFIIRTEKIRLNDPSYRVANADLVDDIENFMEHAKKKYNLTDESEVWKKMEEYFHDLRDGNILSYEDSDYIKSLGFWKTTNKEKEENIIASLKQNIRIFDDYTKSIFNISLFD